MPRSFPTTSPVAVATAHILTAYLSHHKLSPAEAASLSGKITETLASLTSGLDAKSDAQLAPAEEPAPKRQTKPREPLAVGAVGAVGAAVVAEASAALTFETAPEPVAERVDDDRRTEPGVAPAPPRPEAQADAGGDQDVPRRRKRPSRPRSRRGKGAGAPAASGAMPGDEASGDETSGDEAPADEAHENGLIAPEADTGEDTDDDVGAAPKPQRRANRGRRGTAS